MVELIVSSDEFIDEDNLSVTALFQSSQPVDDFDAEVTDDAKGEEHQHDDDFGVDTEDSAGRKSDDEPHWLPQAVVAECRLRLTREDHTVECWRRCRVTLYVSNSCLFLTLAYTHLAWHD